MKSASVIPPVDLQGTDDRVRRSLERVASSRGAVGNVFRVIANSPGALEVMAPVGEYIRYRSSLDPVLRELAILTVAALRGSDYEWSQHLPVARELGVSDDLLDRLVTRELKFEPEPLGSAIRYVQEMASGQEVDPETLATVQVALGDEQLIDLTVLVGYYRLLSDALVTFKVELEDGVKPLRAGSLRPT